MREICFVGLGSMGLPMAGHLINAGFNVRGYDRREAAIQALADKGGAKVTDLASAATGADALVLMVVNIEQARTVLFEGGALDLLAPEASVILMSTCPPASVEALAQEVQSSGRVLIDCPVSGGVTGAESATLTLMVACEDDQLERVRPLLSALGDKLFHVGKRPGQGAVVKSINQLLCGVHIAASAEALSLGQKAGLDAAMLLEILGGSAASSWMLRDRGPRMLETDAPVMSAVDIFVKDLGIVMEAGRDAKAALPLAAHAHQLYLAASGAGEGGNDDSRLIGVYHRMNAIS